MKAEVYHRKMKFKIPSGTSRGILKTKDSWFITLSNDQQREGIGECSIIAGLSPDLDNGLESVLAKMESEATLDCLSEDELNKLPALNFAIETAKLDLTAQGTKQLFPSEFLSGKGIPINGLVWMGTKEFMYDQIKCKLSEGYECIKIKVAAIDFEEELSLLKYIRSQFSKNDIEIRLDANGGFAVSSAYETLSKLSQYEIQSIEQPIAVGQHEEMARLCEKTPIDIALDEELIGITDPEVKKQLLKSIRPQFIILKPSLLGGFAAAENWISLAQSEDIGWWVTSALEANIGLNAIAQWTAKLENPLHQGLGTGQLFTNNLSSPLFIDKGQLYYGGTSWQKLTS